MFYRILIFILFLQLFLFASQDMKRLLVLHSYNQSYSWTNNVQNGINSIFNTTEYEIHIEYMDTKRYNYKEHYQNLIKIYKNKYKNTKFDAIIVSDNNALSFYKFNKEDLFKDAPVIFCGINYLKQSDTEGLTNITGLSEEADVLKNFGLIKKLHPKNKNVFIVVDTTTTGRRAKKEVDKVLKTMPKDGINYKILQGYTLDEVNDFLKDKKGVVLLTVFFSDSKGNSYEYYELVKKLKSSINLPLYGLWDMNFGNGLIGGYLTSGFFQGKEAAKIAKRVLAEENINSIDIVYKSPNRYMFDYLVMKKHNILIKDLPKNHYLINYKKKFLEEYKIEIIFIFVVICVLFSIVFILLINIQKRKKAEEKLLENEKNLEKTVIERTEELSDTIQSLEQAQDQLVHSEKMTALGGLVAGVAHEINTPIGIGLTGVSHFLDITKDVKEEYEKETLSEEEFQTYLNDANELANVIFLNLEKSAELIKSFKQVAVDQTSEVKRSFNIKKYTEEVLISLTNIIKRRDIEIDLKCDDVYIDSYPGAYAQIITNLMMNSLTHAYGKKDKGLIHIEVRKHEDYLHIKFSDEGKGIKEEDINKIFEPFFTTNREFGGSGLGLNIIYNVIKTIFQGEITCNSTLGVGTVFDIELSI